jgi:hypothetical protein
MTETGLQKLDTMPILGRMTRKIILGVCAAGLSACVNVSAPDKPIEINLNIKVTQDVVVRLDGEAKQVIQQNPGIF